MAYVRKHRKLRFSGLIIGLVVLAVTVSGGLYLYFSSQDTYPEAMTNVNNDRKKAGKHKIRKEKNDKAYFVFHYPSTDSKAMNNWIDNETETMLTAIKNERLNDIQQQDPEKRIEVLQDYDSFLTGDRYISVSLRVTIDNEMVHQTSRTFDIENDQAITGALFKHNAQRLITDGARKALSNPTISRKDYLNNVKVEDDFNDISFNENGVRFHFVYGDFDLDLSKNPDYLAFDFADMKANQNPLPSVYLDKGVEGGTKMVAFTFDDGPHPTNSKRVMDIIEQYNGQATFFVLGSRVNEHPQTVKEAMDRGHQVASHSYNHPNFNLTAIPDVLNQIEMTESALFNATGFRSKYYVRPPYGAASNSVRENAGVTFINWNVDSEDWKSKDPEKICEVINRTANDGAIILLHDIYDTSVSGFECAIKKLSEQGYSFVTVEELLESRGYDVKPGDLYYNAKNR